MLTRTQHVFDDATRVVAGESRWQGRTSPDYWAFVGPFGGFTAATILRALIEHPERAGDPLALTVNYCAPIAEGAFDLEVRLLRANRSSQHWCVELSQSGGNVAALATAVFAERRLPGRISLRDSPEPSRSTKSSRLGLPPCRGLGNTISASSKAIRPSPPAPLSPQAHPPSYGSPTVCRARSIASR